jgi:hypothetical protein
MKTRTIASIAALSLSLAACGAGAASEPPAAVASSNAPALDGAAYDVTLEYPGEAPMKDTLNFASGRFESTACTSHGFPKWTDYQSRTDGGNIAFDVTTHHPEGTTVEWHGTVHGGVIEGTANRSMKGKTDVPRERSQVALVKRDAKRLERSRSSGRFADLKSPTRRSTAARVAPA